MFTQGLHETSQNLMHVHCSSAMFVQDSCGASTASVRPKNRNENSETESERLKPSALYWEIDPSTFTLRLTVAFRQSMVVMYLADRISEFFLWFEFLFY